MQGFVLFVDKHITYFIAIFSVYTVFTAFSMFIKRSLYIKFVSTLTKANFYRFFIDSLTVCVYKFILNF